ncbi:hypothetical protein AM587_10000582 [Phytophthora nicotianae]|uniref:Uncharacterized protein n=1 Tax=Phytophthora nicotianae TaxID=4792 RepID=A0A0W8CEP5_PHYNI|nr:hypothetical protein AM587_10000582 [Phytophthora nicotianae]
MYATLGIEQDDSSDDDFIVDSDESEDDQEASGDSGDPVNPGTDALVCNHTHSHPTTATQASTYLTTKTLPLDDQDREDVKTLADARVSSKHITNFLNERIASLDVTGSQDCPDVPESSGH